MGKVALAAKITHVPSMYLSELDGPRKGSRQAAIDGHVEIGRRCRELGVDTIVVFDTHWLVNAELPHQLRAAASRAPTPATSCRTSSATWRTRSRATRHSASCWPGCATSTAWRRCAHPATTLGPEYGTLVPMRYMNADQHFKVVSVSALCTVHYLNDSARLGWAMRKAVEEHYDGTVAFLASGSLEPPLRAERPGGPEYAFKIWSAFLEALDHEVVEMWKRGDWKTFCEMLPEYAEQGPRRRLHARHGDAARRARLVGLRRPGRGRHAVLRRLGHRADQRHLPGHAAGRPRGPKAVASSADGYSTVATRL